MSEQSTFWLEEHLVKISQSQVSEPEWMETVATSPSNFLGLLTGRGPNGWSGKMSPVFSPQLPTSLPIHVRRKSTWTVQTDPKTGQKSWSKTNTTQTKTMRSPVSWPDFQNSGTSMLTGLLTLNTSEFRNGAVASSLSDILETGAVPQRYFLTGTACRGILRRAEKRGKELPIQLLRALQEVAEVSSGGGDSRGQDPVVSVESPGQYWDGSDTADTLDASNASKQQAMPEKRRFQAVIETTHSLRADGFDASEDGTRRGTPLVPVAAHMTGALDSSSPQAQAVAFNLRGREGGAMAEMAEMASVRAASGGSSRSCVGTIGWSEELTASEECAGTISRGGQGGQGGRHDGA